MYVEALAGLSPGRDLAQFVDTLKLRIHSLLAPGPLASILQPEDGRPADLESWLTDYVGADQAENGPIAVVDLSLVPTDVIHIVVSVLGRIIFESLQRYRRENGRELPTTLILEEAHTFVHRELGGESAPPAGRECARVFERIAREGRKFRPRPRAGLPTTVGGVTYRALSMQHVSPASPCQRPRPGIW